MNLWRPCAKPLACFMGFLYQNYYCFSSNSNKLLSQGGFFMSALIPNTHLRIHIKLKWSTF